MENAWEYSFEKKLVKGSDIVNYPGRPDDVLIVEIQPSYEQINYSPKKHRRESPKWTPTLPLEFADIDGSSYDALLGWVKLYGIVDSVHSFLDVENMHIKGQALRKAIDVSRLQGYHDGVHKAVCLWKAIAGKDGKSDIAALKTMIELKNGKVTWIGKTIFDGGGPEVEFSERLLDLDIDDESLDPIVLAACIYLGGTINAGRKLFPSLERIGLWLPTDEAVSRETLRLVDDGSFGTLMSYMWRVIYLRTYGRNVFKEFPYRRCLGFDCRKWIDTATKGGQRMRCPTCAEIHDREKNKIDQANKRARERAFNPPAPRGRPRKNPE